MVNLRASNKTWGQVTTDSDETSQSPSPRTRGWGATNLPDTKYQWHCQQVSDELYDLVWSVKHHRGDNICHQYNKSHQHLRSPTGGWAYGTPWYEANWFPPLVSSQEPFYHNDGTFISLNSVFKPLSVHLDIFTPLSHVGQRSDQWKLHLVASSRLQASHWRFLVK